MDTLTFDTVAEFSAWLQDQGERAEDANYHEFAEFYFETAVEIREMEPPLMTLTPVGFDPPKMARVNVG